MADGASQEGPSRPPGVRWIAAEKAYDFALFSRGAESVKLLFFSKTDVSTPIHTRDLDLPGHSSRHVWHCRIPAQDIQQAEYYSYQVDGPERESTGAPHLFDREKVLVDPYAKSLYFPPTFDRQMARRPGSNLGRAPVGVLRIDEKPFEWGDDRKPEHTSNLIIYELHVRGFTRRETSGVTPEKRGTYSGIVEKIDHLKDLGVTAVEILPVFQFDPQEENYWGYMPLSFFAPHNRHSSSDVPQEQLDEFREMVKALHAVDIEVILDVVYNHTGESDEKGPTYNLRGIDNTTYYLSSDDPKKPYLDFSGTGNSLNCANRATRRLILDSMRYWVQEMHVDGFRFDLASVLARKPDGSIDKKPAIFTEIAADPVFRSIRLIAEPWDAAGAYQLGTSFPGHCWKQWNDKFRDDIRRFVRGDLDLVGRVMSRLHGSSDIFPETESSPYPASRSINYITSHDGFTVYDLVSYDEKHNAANSQRGQDGHDQNFSWNSGTEGDDGLSDEILALRKKQVKNFCCFLFLSNGTPMFLAGDEFLQTQKGNNNPYNQDNEITWLDWSRLQEHGDIFRFYKLMIAFRKAHPVLGRSRYWNDDTHWYGIGKDVDMTYHSRSLAYSLRGASANDCDLYVMINGFSENLDFEIQGGGPERWQLIIDTAEESPDDFREEGREIAMDSRTRRVRARSFVVLVRR